MTSTIPPRPATWLLLHLMAGDRDEALTGDLLEEFRTGRSESWYWRQTLIACLVSWSLALQARLPLMFFALAWSMLAPAWQLACEHVASSPITASLPNIFGGFWIIPALTGWTILHGVFVWVGALLYSATHGTFGTPLPNDKIRRGLLLTPIVLDVVYAVTFFVGTLYYYSIPGLSEQHLAATVTGRIADVRLLPDLMRFPYFVALLSALWGAIPTSSCRRIRVDQIGESIAIEENQQHRVSESHQQAFSVNRFVAMLAATSSMNALLAGFLLCRLPEFHASNLTSLMLRAFAFVFTGIFGGVAGTWLYWKSPWSPFREQTPFSLGLFVLVCASSWAWAPAVAIYSEQLTAATAFATATGTYLLFAGLRDAAPMFAHVLPDTRSVSEHEKMLFADVLASPRFELHSYVIAVAIYAGCAALFLGARNSAAIIFGLGAAVFAWCRPGNLRDSLVMSGWKLRPFAIRLTVASLFAVLATAWAMLDEAKRPEQVVASTAEPTAKGESQSGNRSSRSTNANSEYQGVGYESLILWPTPEKQKIDSPMLTHAPLFPPGTTTPITVRFSGSYRYVQPPNKHPGPDAHKAYGTPLDANIESNNSIPVMMDAHQHFASPIQTDHCRAVQVQIANFDNIAGSISLAVMLSEDSAHHVRSLYLGQRLITSTLPGHFSLKSEPVFETLEFSLPPHADLAQFDQITVLILPDIEHSLIAPRIAVEQFRLFPR